MSFAERYKLKSNADLINILDNADSYQSAAIEAAKLEITTRALTNEQFAEARAENTATQLRQEREKSDFLRIENKIKDFGSRIGETLDPIVAETIPDRTAKAISTISVFLAFCFVYDVFANYELLVYLISASDMVGSVPILLSLLFLLIVPVAAILLWLHKKPGWMITTAFFSFTFLSSVIFFIGRIGQGIHSVDAMSDLLQSPIASIVTATLYFLAIRTLCKVEIREVFKVDRHEVVTAAVAGVLLTIVHFFRIYFDNLALFALLIVFPFVVWRQRVMQRRDKNENAILQNIQRASDVSYAESLYRLKQLIKKEKTSVWSDANILKRNLEEFCSTRREGERLLTDYEELFQSSIVEDISNTSTSYDRIADLLSPLIALGLIEPKYPHQRISDRRETIS